MVLDERFKHVVGRHFGPIGQNRVDLTFQFRLDTGCINMLNNELAHDFAHVVCHC